MPENPLNTVIAQVTALLTDLRERSEAAGEQAQKRLGEAQSRAQNRVDETRDSALTVFEDAKNRLSSLPVELPTEIDELLTRFSPDELRKVAEAYLAVAAGLLTALSERGEEVVERLKTQPLVEENLPRLEKVYNDALGITEDALGTISTQTRAVGERAATMAGLSTGSADEVTLDAVPAKKAPAKSSAAQKTPAKKVAAKKAAATKAPAKKAPAKKAPAKKAAAKKSPAKKAPTKKAESVQEPAKKAVAKKAAKKAPAKKAPAKKTPPQRVNPDEA
ncbi:histone H1-like repetitive region-containing protein [Gordonia sp. Z-3]|jgi:heparin binding hemagglutinin HbhA|uniref:Histone H1-like repetitive region-containing protein n=1 Tax=Gordonia tangerina TaxID=2911060 RepID=A0ABS9DM11_9ACTN|nr:MULTISPECIES: histone H1-like repetitive region-containing protein [Gordonia]MAU81794.1 heparin-binding hemagglutinin [Gordonia sp. (in: high G+C Gram-positive bacteria)]MCF3939225.1 histone H1-like repetitive region-containing protein [Gordonia tangerina]MED5800504.1 histone H1-like repetitive region-containing protein [Gordonia sp. Z-3]